MAGQTINVDKFVAMMMNTDAESLSRNQDIDLNDVEGDEINLSLQIPNVNSNNESSDESDRPSSSEDSEGDPRYSSESVDMDTDDEIGLLIRGRPRVRTRGGVRARGRPRRGGVRSSLETSNGGPNACNVVRGRARGVGPRLRVRGGRGRIGHRQQVRVRNSPPVARAVNENVWSDVAQDPPDFPFNENSGLLIQIDHGSPGAYFDQFLTEELIERMVRETNHYAASEINKNRPLKKESRLKY